jgi:aryl-phospho-beta-D-glucosidase BglC (GH1 family)
MRTNRRDFLKMAGATVVSASLSGRALGAEPKEQPGRRVLPRWRGFNLLEKFYRNDPFRETDFQWISEWGFDFVRLPMDYRQWTDADDPYAIKEPVIEHIDQAIELGRKYGVHVSLNLHNAPGYSVNRAAKQTLNLWKDAEAQKQFAFQWSNFARRYRGIPSSQLSFNLVNEPANIDELAYVKAVRGAIDGIRAADPTRLIITDGLNWGREPVLSLASEGVAQSTRGYEPFGLTHYRANWVSGADRFPLPQWPVPQVNGHLYGPGNRELHSALVIEGRFEQAMALRIRVGQVSSRGRLLVQADDRTILEKDFRPGPGAGEWKEAVFAEQWKVYQNIYDRDYTAAVPAGTKRVRLANAEGDWLTVREVGLGPAEDQDAPEHILTVTDTAWGRPQREPVKFDPNANGPAFVAPRMQDRQWLYNDRILPWKKVADAGVGVHVGEWGAFRFTPHDVVLRWARDQLSLWTEAGFGWALWNFRGTFGILDSNRDDVQYEEFRGHKLDRKFLTLLREFA